MAETTTVNGVSFVPMLSMEWMTGYFGVSSKTVHNWVNDKKIAVHKIGGRFLFEAKDVAAFKARCRTAALGEGK